jgi:N-acetylneuraminate lyase
MHRLTGLIAATYTPMRDDGALNLDAVGPLVEHLIETGVAGLYVCGSTGEGVSLGSDERRAVTRAYVEAAARRLPVVVQVGHNSLAEARTLAEHASDAGADAISASPPSYFKPADVRTLTDCMAEIAAAAPMLPFYYYHIPSMTGVTVDMPAFLREAGDRIKSLAGIKFTDSRLDVYQACLAVDGGRYEVLWGFDEMLLSALAVGARGAVGSTYNIAAPVYRQVIDAFAAGDMDAAREAQLRAVRMIHVLLRYPLHPAIKQVLGWLGHPCGPCRLPLRRMRDDEVESLRRDLDAIGYFDWCGAPGATQRM